MSLTAAKLVSLYPAAAPYAPALLAGMTRDEIASRRQQAHFLSQIAVESAQFRRVRESLNYSVDGLLDVFGRHRISVANAQRLGRIPGRPADQAGIANIVYGGEWGRRNLGNTEAGDGWRFIGRGLKQVTGRANYTRCDAALQLGRTLLTNPAQLEQPDAAVASALWFWRDYNLNAIAAAGTVEAVTRVVNGGVNGLAEREQQFARVLQALS